MTSQAARRAAALLILCLSLAACDGTTTKEGATWRADCPQVTRPAPLSLEAAREAHRTAARRQELRLREAAAPGSFLREMQSALDAKRVAAGQVCLEELADLGQLLF